jgi:Pyruvate/2-oxoacid:ferredoxin oxidoreductase gamma subunit
MLEVLSKLKAIGNFSFNKAMDINFMDKNFYNVKGVKLVNQESVQINEEWNNLPEEEYRETLKNNGRYKEIDYKNKDGVDAEIRNRGEHVISKESDLPTFV